MSHGSLMAMPILVINMGVEMVYILEQRLSAQKIPGEKGQKVLQDVVKTMYYPRFIDELFKPQKIYSLQSTRQIFDRLAHSSIMRLNESSMDKLFDLMAMGFKYQLVTCTSPTEIINVTVNHLQCLRNIVKEADSLTALLDQCQATVVRTYGQMSSTECAVVRQTLLSFFQDRKVKVSLFLQEGIQNPDGHIVVPASGHLPVEHALPGAISYYAAGSVVRQDNIPPVCSTMWSPAGEPKMLGENLYTKQRTNKAAPPPAAAPTASAGPQAPASDTLRQKAATAELNALASLIKPTSEAPDNFSLKLFQDNDPNASPGEEKVLVMDFAGDSLQEAHKNQLAGVGQEFSGLGVDDRGADDLLDLMDKA
mmetsp:Transcript_87815/g.235005  ORF Transcript_87815/g.235005 Transcript_87815/m.235005 type:complete len:366 (-) Transcript_87815:134-1231(-)